MNESQRRAFAALQIGPAWRLRDLEHPAPRAAQAPAAPLAGAGEATRAAAIAAMDWQALHLAVVQCQACALASSRTQTVFGSGDPQAGWMLIGEAPGAEEDRRGEPFVGNAGRLLDAMLAALGLSREKGVFIANTLKCRPPGNRDPLPEELQRCQPFLQRQIALIAPRVIVLLGRVAAHALLQTDASVASLRGRVHTCRIGERAIPVVVTYHPAYLLRNLPDKARAWTDLCLARSIHDAGAGTD
ncbi:MAG: uracil-DNA glycosylase [Burkholderiaceae bacterium]|nr:uracil-DNA glycosylase [Burkholderiaceae bacterium]